MEMFGKKDNDNLEEKIQEEIRKQVIKKSMADKELNKQKEDEEGNLAALEEISDLPKKEIEEIARQVRKKHMNSPKNFSKKSIVPIWGGFFALVIALLFVFVLYDNQDETSLKKAFPVSEKKFENRSLKIARQKVKSSKEFLLAAKKGDRSLIQLFLDKGMDINVQDKYGNTALIIASSSGQLKTIEFLLDKGANPMITDLHGKTALDYAENYFGKNHDVIKETLIWAEAKKRSN